MDLHVILDFVIIINKIKELEYKNGRGETTKWKSEEGRKSLRRNGSTSHLPQSSGKTISDLNEVLDGPFIQHCEQSPKLDFFIKRLDLAKKM